MTDMHDPTPITPLEVSRLVALWATETFTTEKGSEEAWDSLNKAGLVQHVLKVGPSADRDGMAEHTTFWRLTDKGRDLASRMLERAAAGGGSFDGQ